MIYLGLTDVQSVRDAFAAELERLGDEAPGQVVDLQGVSFIADAPAIFGEVNEEYVRRELEWYLSQSLNVNDIPGGAPKIWQQVADPGGFVNSNYGTLLLGKDNGSLDPDAPDGEGILTQFQAVVQELKRDPSSRRAVAIYTNPNMHWEATEGDKQDFVCTNTVQYRVTGGQVDAFVNMRSNDAVFGYRNDLAWQRYALEMVAAALDVPPRHVVWQAASLHVYPRHHNLISHYAATGEWDVPLNTGKEPTE